MRESVLAAVAGRLTDPDEGQVLLDGVPLDRLTRKALRTEVAYAFERPAPAEGTIAEVVAARPPAGSRPNRSGRPAGPRAPTASSAGCRAVTTPRCPRRRSRAASTSASDSPGRSRTPDGC
ncbi:hypothetical protein GCM10023238_03650 [Streptomyces heliomycini]